MRVCEVIARVYRRLIGFSVSLGSLKYLRISVHDASVVHSVLEAIHKL